LPVGVGKLVYFYNPKGLQENKLPGLVISSQKTHSVVFILGPSNIITTDFLIGLSASKMNQKKSSDFIINLDLTKFFGNVLDIFGNSSNGVKTHFLRLPKPLNGVSDRKNV
jgi:hypothetical protein